MFSISRSALAYGVLMAASLAFPAFAANEPTSMKSGQIGCLSLKDALAYEAYAKSSPAFAEDLLSRAACFAAKEDMQAIQLTNSKGFNKIKLLSGHTVWVPRK